MFLFLSQKPTRTSHGKLSPQAGGYDDASAGCSQCATGYGRQNLAAGQRTFGKFLVNKWLIVYRGINWTEAIYFAFAGHDPLVEVNHQVYKTYTNLMIVDYTWLL